MTEQLDRPGFVPGSRKTVHLGRAVLDHAVRLDSASPTAPADAAPAARAGRAVRVVDLDADLGLTLGVAETSPPPGPEVGGDGEALVVCIGTTPDQNTRVLQSVGPDALVVVAADTGSLVQLLNGVRGTAREAPSRPQPTLSRGRLHIDRGSREVHWDGRPIPLSARGFDLLCVLASEEGRVWSFADLTARVWRRDYLGDDDSVTSAVKRLRARLSAVTRDVSVVSVRGVGYRLAVRG